MRLPIIGREAFVNGYSAVEEHERRERTPGLAARRDEFPFLAGQPEEVRAAYRRAMGLDGPVQGRATGAGSERSGPGSRT